MSAYVADSEHMFTETLTKRVRRSSLLDLLTGPHGVDRYTELVDPTWTRGEGRARVVGVRRNTPRSVTLTLDPNRPYAVTAHANSAADPGVFLRIGICI